ncbi:MAG: hypothetical protein EB053_06650 [Chlamydiae bacterium]|nr:hypothetical protein [Chlamydiota bacterium]
MLIFFWGAGACPDTFFSFLLFIFPVLSFQLLDVSPLAGKRVMRHQPHYLFDPNYSSSRFRTATVYFFLLFLAISLFFRAIFFYRFASFTLKPSYFPFENLGVIP